MMYKCILWVCTVLTLYVYTPLAVVPKVTIGAIFDAEDHAHFNSIFYRGFQENQLLQKNNITLHPWASYMSTRSGVANIINSLCNFFEGRDIRALLVVGKQETVEAAGHVAQPLGIPIVGYTIDVPIDTQVQVRQYL